MDKKKYNREVVISKLLAKGLKAKPDERHIEYFLVPHRVSLGIKSLGMIDFLKARIERPKQKQRPIGEKPKVRPPRDTFKIIGQCDVCRKEVNNRTGFFRLTFSNRLVQLHKGKCKRQSDMFLEKR